LQPVAPLISRLRGILMTDIADIEDADEVELPPEALALVDTDR
jgi:hypothetical protein